MITRFCKLPKQNSFFLFGPRLCGKTTLINEHLSERDDSWSISLLQSDTSLRYLKNPSLFRKEVMERITTSKGTLKVVFIDEIQKIPALLDEVQLLLDTTELQFILTGSSARKIKRGNANLLGGRAVTRHLFPFLAQELGSSFNLEDTLIFGALPKIVLTHERSDKIDLLNGYVTSYLQEEIQQEAIVRNVSGFLSFLEVAAQHSGELLNFSSIARDADINPRTVQNYYQILEDTLLGVRLPAYRRSIRQRLRSAPKFYLFDLGVRNALERQLRSTPDATRYGKLFEHFIVQETHRTVQYSSSDGQVSFWRTKDDMEVDIIIESRGTVKAAVEIKSSERVSEQYLKGLLAFQADHPNVPCYVVAKVPERYMVRSVTVLPWAQYLRELESWL
jgi:uncharacterized protein